jgi:hypothetical protein
MLDFPLTASFLSGRLVLSSNRVVLSGCSSQSEARSSQSED